MADTGNLRVPNTRTIIFEGLRQAFQARIAQVWSNVTMAGEREREERFKRGVINAIEAYEKAWHAIDKHLKEK